MAGEKKVILIGDPNVIGATVGYHLNRMFSGEGLPEIFETAQAGLTALKNSARRNDIQAIVIQDCVPVTPQNSNLDAPKRAHLRYRTPKTAFELLDKARYKPKAGVIVCLYTDCPGFPLTDDQAEIINFVTAPMSTDTPIQLVNAHDGLELGLPYVETTPAP